jgi:hypothetical protein
MYASKNVTSVVRVIGALIASFYSILFGVKRPADDAVSDDEKVIAAPAGEKIAAKRDGLREYAYDTVFLLGIICIALMLLLGLAIPAIVAVGLCLLLVERRTRYRTAFAGKAARV